MRIPTADPLSVPPSRWLRSGSAPTSAQPTSAQTSSAQRKPSPVARTAAPWGAISLATLGLLLLALVGAAAPNDHTLDSRLPLSWLPALPGSASTYLTFAAIAAQGFGLLGMLTAAGRGWSPAPRRLLLAGGGAVLLLCFGTPIGSADLGSYAAYGRIAALGGDPYQMVPADLGGAYAHLVSDSWQHTPSVYGPVATWIQQLAATIGADRLWLTVWVLMLLNAAAYLLTGLLLVGIAADRTRAALLWAANPLLIGQLVGGGHLDTYVALFGACAVAAALRAKRLRHELIVGALLALACGVKISVGLLAVGLSWPLLRARAWKPVLVRATACLLVLAALYAPFGLHALAPLSGASGLVSVASLWQLLSWIGRSLVGAGTTSALIGVAWPVVMVVLAWLLHRWSKPQSPERVSAALLATYALAFAWILSAPWCMPWYTAIVWPLAALMPRNRTDRWLIFVTLFLSLVHNTGGHGWSW